MSALPDKFKWGEKLRKLDQMKRELPQVLANEGQRFFLNEFDVEQWNGQQWKPRKNRRNTKALLVNTGVLRGGVARSIREANFNRIRWAVGVPYAEYQNDGTRTIPKRKFFGDSPLLRRKILEKINQAAKRIFKP